MGGRNSLEFSSRGEELDDFDPADTIPRSRKGRLIYRRTSSIIRI